MKFIYIILITILSIGCTKTQTHISGKYKLTNITMVENGVETSNTNTIYPNSTIQIDSVEVGVTTWEFVETNGKYKPFILNDEHYYSYSLTSYNSGQIFDDMEGKLHGSGRFFIYKIRGDILELKVSDKYTEGEIGEVYSILKFEKI